MVIDSSAFIAILLHEPECDPYLHLIEQAELRRVSAASVLETSINLESRRGEDAAREFDLFLVRSRIEIVSVDSDQVEVARAAWRRYGKGRHPAALNICDCFVYALAKTLDEPLLAKGKDFSLTDIRMADAR